MNRYKEEVVEAELKDIIYKLEIKKNDFTWPNFRMDLVDKPLLGFLPVYINRYEYINALIHWIEFFVNYKPKAIPFIVQKVNDNKLILWKEDLTVTKKEQNCLDMSINKPVKIHKEKSIGKSTTIETFEKENSKLENFN